MSTLDKDVCISSVPFHEQQLQLFLNLLNSLLECHTTLYVCYTFQKNMHLNDPIALNHPSQESYQEGI